MKFVQYKKTLASKSEFWIFIQRSIQFKIYNENKAGGVYFVMASVPEKIGKTHKK